MEGIRKRTSRKDAEPSVREASFEESVAELESIIERIEQGAIGLEESLRQFKRGDELVKRCRAILDRAEHEVAELSVESVEAMGSAPAGSADLAEEHPFDEPDGDGRDE